MRAGHAFGHEAFISVGILAERPVLATSDTGSAHREFSQSSTGLSGDLDDAPSRKLDQLIGIFSNGSIPRERALPRSVIFLPVVERIIFSPRYVDRLIAAIVFQLDAGRQHRLYLGEQLFRPIEKFVR